MNKQADGKLCTYESLREVKRRSNSNFLFGLLRLNFVSPCNDVRAFTLAEVLITLGIIGVVAAMTIKTLTAYVQDVEYSAALKKVYATFASATTSIKSDNGGDMQGIWIDNSTVHFTANSFGNLYAKYIKTEKICAAVPDPADSNQCWHKNGTTYNLDGSSYVGGWCSACSVLQSSQGFWAEAFIPGGYEYFDCEGVIANGPSNICLGFTVDTNGIKPPNRTGYDIHILYITKYGVGYKNNGRTYDLLTK